MTMRRLDPIRTSILLAVAGLGACVFGFRGQVEFADEANLAGLDTVQLHLPATTLTLTGDPDRSFVDWSGSWSTLGGSANDALAGANRAAMVWETWEQVGRLHAEIPAELVDITALDALTVESAAGLAHEIRGTGDVFVSGIDGFLAITLAGGNVEVQGGLEQLVVASERGDLILRTSAAVDAHTGLGRVEIQSDAPRDLIVDARGPVAIELANVGSLDLDIADAGQIIVDLDSASHVGAGHYRRRIGPGGVTVQVRAGGGPVTLRMLADDDGPDGSDGTSDGTGTDTGTDTTGP